MSDHSVTLGLPCNAPTVSAGAVASSNDVYYQDDRLWQWLFVLVIN